MRSVRLGAIVDVQSGFAFKTEFFSGDEGVPLIRIRDLPNTSTETRYRGDFREDFTVDTGDYLIGMDGNFRCHRWQGPRALLNQRVCRLRNFDPSVVPEYIYYGIQKKLHEIETNTSFATVKHISARQIQNIELVLPRVEEQRRIVDILSRAEGIMRLRHEAQKKTAEIIPALFLDMFGDPATNPKGWPIVTLGTLLAEAPILGTMAKPSHTTAHWLDLRVANIQNGQLTLEDKKWIDLPDNQAARFALRPGDILLARAIGSLDHLGKAVLVNPTGDWTFDSHLMRVRLDRAKLLPETLKAFLESNGGREAFLKHTRQSAVQFNINGKELRLIELPLPPMARQREFVDGVRAVSSVQSQQEDALSKAESTFDALLARAFM